MMKNAEKWVHPTKFTGDYPNWNGYTFLDWHKKNNVFHPADDYNFGWGNQDLGQDAVAAAAGVCVHASSSKIYYGKIAVIKCSLGYNLKRFIKERYGIETDELYLFYAHLKDIKVNVGDVVDVGQVIGHVGKSGTTWAHLHFEIYAPIGELKKKAWRFYPTGWSKERIKQFWLPAYSFIEAFKQAKGFAETFLGKPKKYWKQVEKDRNSLLKQVGEIEGKWAKRLEKAEKSLSSYRVESAKMVKKIENLEASAKKQLEDFDKERQEFKDKLKNKDIRISEILKDNAKNYKFMEALKLVFRTIRRW